MDWREVASSDTRKEMNAFEDGQSHYDVLEVTPDSTPQQIREAYLRLKSAYGKDSLALYSLIGRDDMESTLKKVEDAYLVLSNPVKRQEYDRNHGTSGVTHDPKIVSIDRTPPMEIASTPDDLFSVPTTDFTPNERVIEDEIQNEAEWRGSFIKKIREFRSLTIEEIAEHTKVSRGYIRAIEDETFEKLPATVFLRGFLIQIAKKLKIPQDKLTNSYIARYRQAHPERG